MTTLKSAGRKKPEASIAVLPFEDLSPEKDLEYLCDGLTEEIINALDGIKGVYVIGMITALLYKDTKKDFDEIGENLGVETILRGSVRLEVSGTRISAHLVRVADGEDLWRYDLHLKNIIDVQEKISLGLVDKLKVELMKEEKAALLKRQTHDVSAYNLYLKGRYHWNKRSAKGLKKAVDYFKQAVAEDDQYALAYAGIADSYNILGFYNELPPNEAFPKGKKAAIQALSVDDSIAEAHTSLGFALLYNDWDWKESEKEFNKAFDLKKGYATAHHWYTEYLVAMGRLEEAIAKSKKALEYDPLALIINTLLGFTYYYAGEFDKAVEQLEKTIGIDPEFFPAYFFLGLTCSLNGELDKAVSGFEKAKNIFGGTMLIEASLGHSYAASGDTAKARTILDDLLARSNKTYVSPYYTAAIYADLGEHDQAFSMLEKALNVRDNWLIFLKVDPIWKDLRQDERFGKIVKTMKLEK